MDLIDNKTEQTTQEEVVVRPHEEQESEDDELGGELDQRLEQNSDVNLEDIHEQNQRIIEVLEKIHAEMRGDAGHGGNEDYQSNTVSKEPAVESSRNEDNTSSSGTGIDLPGGGL
nr:MAG: hypothetical protein J07AB56_05880 [Candidatus Nanosalinarum sp. J07AB56]